MLGANGVAVRLKKTRCVCVVSVPLWFFFLRKQTVLPPVLSPGLEFPWACLQIVALFQFGEAVYGIMLHISHRLTIR